MFTCFKEELPFICFRLSLRHEGSVTQSGAGTFGTPSHISDALVVIPIRQPFLSHLRLCLFASLAAAIAIGIAIAIATITAIAIATGAISIVIGIRTVTATATPTAIVSAIAIFLMLSFNAQLSFPFVFQ